MGTIPGRPPTGQPVRWWAGPLPTEGRRVGRRPRSSPSGGKPAYMAKGASKSAADVDWNDQEVASVNTDDLEAALYRAERRVLKIQTKLHRWACDDPGRRFDDLFNLVADPAFLLVAWDRVRGNRGARSAGVDRRTAVIHRAACRGRGLPRHAAVHAQGPQLPPAAGAGADDPQTRRQAAPAGDRHDDRPGGPGLPEAGAGADLRGGFPPVLLRVPSEPPGS